MADGRPPFTPASDEPGLALGSRPGLKGPHPTDSGSSDVGTHFALASPRYPVCDYCGRPIPPTIRHNGGTFTPTTCTDHADLPRLDPMREAL